MNIEELCELIPPPIKPVDIGASSRWKQIEDEMGLSLPDDYKQFINLYGTIHLSNFIYILNPFTKISGLNLIEQSEEILDGFQSLGSFGGEKYLYPLYPSKGGLLPWGFTINGDTLFWFTTGDPKEWTIAVDESRGAFFESYSESFSSFLVKILKKKIQSEILGNDLSATYQIVK